MVPLPRQNGVMLEDQLGDHGRRVHQKQLLLENRSQHDVAVIADAGQGAGGGGHGELTAAAHALPAGR